MNKNLTSIALASFCAFFCASWSHAESDQSSDKPRHVAPGWEKADQAQAAANEAKAMTEKVKEETKLQVFKQKVESLFQAELEANMAKETAKKAEAEAQFAAASAAKSEALLRDMKARTEIKALEQASQAICEAQLAKAKYERIENEMKLAKLQHERETLFPTLK